MPLSWFEECWPLLKESLPELPENLNINLTLWPINSGVLTSLLLPHLSSSLTDSLPSLNLLCHSKTDARCMQDAPKAVWSIPYIPVAAFFPSLKQNFTAYHSSKVSLHPDCIFEIHQLWQSGFNRVYSNSCCSYLFEPEIIKISQSSHKMYSNNILYFQESTTILNACTKKVWKLIECTTYVRVLLMLSSSSSLCIFFTPVSLKSEWLTFLRSPTLTILADLNSTVIWMVLIFPPISSYPGPLFFKLLRTISKTIFLLRE